MNSSTSRQLWKYRPRYQVQFNLRKFLIILCAFLSFSITIVDCNQKVLNKRHATLSEKLQNQRKGRDGRDNRNPSHVQSLLSRHLNPVDNKAALIDERNSSSSKFFDASSQDEQEAVLFEYVFVQVFRTIRHSLRILSDLIRMSGDTLAGVMIGVVKSTGGVFNLLAGMLWLISSKLEAHQQHMLRLSSPSYNFSINVVTPNQTSSTSTTSSNAVANWGQRRLRRSLHFIGEVSGRCAWGAENAANVLHGVGEACIWSGEILESLTLGLGEAVQDSFWGLELVSNSSKRVVEFLLQVDKSLLDQHNHSLQQRSALRQNLSSIETSQQSSELPEGANIRKNNSNDENDIDIDDTLENGETADGPSCANNTSSHMKNSSSFSMPPSSSSSSSSYSASSWLASKIRQLFVDYALDAIPNRIYEDSLVATDFIRDGVWMLHSFSKQLMTMLLEANDLSTRLVVPSQGPFFLLALCAIFLLSILPLPSTRIRIAVLVMTGLVLYVSFVTTEIVQRSRLIQQSATTSVHTLLQQQSLRSHRVQSSSSSSSSTSSQATAGGGGGGGPYNTSIYALWQFDDAAWLNAMTVALWEVLDAEFVQTGGLGPYISEMYADMVNAELMKVPPGVANVRLKHFELGHNSPLVAGIRVFTSRNHSCIRETTVTHHPPKKSASPGPADGSSSNTSSNSTTTGTTRSTGYVNETYPIAAAAAASADRKGPATSSSSSSRRRKRRTSGKQQRSPQRQQQDHDDHVNLNMNHVFSSLGQASTRILRGVRSSVAHLSSDRRHKIINTPHSYSSNESATASATASGTDAINSVNTSTTSTLSAGNSSRSAGVNEQQQQSQSAFGMMMNTVFQFIEEKSTAIHLNPLQQQQNQQKQRLQEQVQRRRHREEREDGQGRATSSAAHEEEDEEEEDQGDYNNMPFLNQFSSKCDRLVVEMDTTYASEDMDIELSLRSNDLKSLVPDVTVTLEELYVAGQLRLNMKLTPDYPFIGDAEVSFIQPPQMDFEIRSLGGIELSTVPYAYYWVNATLHWVLGQYTSPYYTVIDLRHTICPSCDTNVSSMTSPSLRESLLEAAGFLRNMSIHTHEQLQSKWQQLERVALEAREDLRGFAERPSVEKMRVFFRRARHWLIMTRDRAKKVAAALTAIHTTVPYVHPPSPPAAATASETSAATAATAANAASPTNTTSSAHIDGDVLDENAPRQGRGGGEETK